MMWSNDVVAVWGWGGCLLLLVALLAFWGVVIAGVMTLFETARRPRTGHTADVPSGSPAGGAANTRSVGDALPDTAGRESP